MSDPEDAALLLAWLETAELPTAPYQLGPGLRVEDPALSHEVLRRNLSEGGGQVLRAVVARAKRLKDLCDAIGERIESGEIRVEV